MKNFSYALKKVTPMAMKVLQKHGMRIGENGNITDLLLKISVDEQACREVCSVIFEDDFTRVKFEDFDLEKISEGVHRFLFSYLNPTLS